jgi:hypothetical protein
MPMCKPTLCVPARVLPEAAYAATSLPFNIVVARCLSTTPSPSSPGASPAPHSPLILAHTAAISPANDSDGHNARVINNHQRVYNAGKLHFLVRGVPLQPRLCGRPDYTVSKRLHGRVSWRASLYRGRVRINLITYICHKRGPKDNIDDLSNHNGHG